MIPEYILKLLRTYGNAYISERQIRAIGGTDALLGKLRDSGFDCEIRRYTSPEGDPMSGRKRAVDTIITVKEE